MTFEKFCQDSRNPGFFYMNNLEPTFFLLIPALYFLSGFIPKVLQGVFVIACFLLCLFYIVMWIACATQLKKLHVMNETYSVITLANELIMFIGFAIWLWNYPFVQYQGAYYLGFLALVIVQCICFVIFYIKFKHSTYPITTENGMSMAYKKKYPCHYSCEKELIPLLDTVFGGSERSKEPFKLQMSAACNAIVSYPDDIELQSVPDDIFQQLKRIKKAQDDLTKSQKDEINKAMDLDKMKIKQQVYESLADSHENLTNLADNFVKVYENAKVNKTFLSDEDDI